MELKMWKTGLFLTVLILAVTLSNGQQKSCRAVFSEQNKKQLGWINDCVKQLGYKTGREKAQKSACVMKCVLNNLQLLNSEGFVDAEQYKIFLTSQWPEHLRERARVTFQPCLKLERVIVPGNDEFCKGIEPVTKCLTRNFSNLCKGAK